jgi:hypothetical protein
VSLEIETAKKALPASPTTVSLRPRDEGNNINTWIGGPTTSAYGSCDH